ncbi:hypothetical protein LC653_36335 [Nostoc sp. CHAB 5784]|nr:hypothetical protein [Nostoc mirabile]MCC5669172.1 hypothetical protein [Nostoc mirabile CHAB5784]
MANDKSKETDLPRRRRTRDDDIADRRKEDAKKIKPLPKDLKFTSYDDVK